MDAKGFVELMSLPYEHKVSFAKGKAQEFYDEMKGKVFCSVGGLDSDDGVTQRITVKSGITKVENIPVPNPVILAPFRTFAEVDQPPSNFIFRMKGGDSSPTCALFEADGGAWALEAVRNIKEWLTANLPESVVVLA